MEFLTLPHEVTREFLYLFTLQLQLVYAGWPCLSQGEMSLAPHMCHVFRRRTNPRSIHLKRYTRARCTNLLCILESVRCQMARMSVIGTGHCHPGKTDLQ